VQSTVRRWALVAFMIGIIAAGYLWLNGAPGIWQVGGSSLGPSGATVAASASVPAPGPGQQKVVLENLGMACPLCRAAVSATLGRTPGIIMYTVDLGTDSATVLFDPSQMTVDGLKQAIAEAGYQVRGVREIQE
jgi:copper chaperone CopZ